MLIYVLLSAMPVAALAILYYKFGKEAMVQYGLQYEHDIPHTVSPMILPGLLKDMEKKDNIHFNSLLATAFDLARRGYLEIREERVKMYLGTHEYLEQTFLLTVKGMAELQTPTELKDFELDALKFIMSCGYVRDKVTSKEITEYFRNNSDAAKEKTEIIGNKALDWFKKNIFPLREAITPMIMRIFRGTMVVFLLLTFFFLIMFVDAFALVPIAFFAVSLFIPRFISRRTYQYILEVKRWKAFKRFLSDFPAMKEAPDSLLNEWEIYLVYSIALGIPGNFLRNLNQLSTEKNQPIAVLGWYRGLTPTPKGMVSPASFADLTNSLSSSISAITSAISATEDEEGESRIT